MPAAGGPVRPACGAGMPSPAAAPARYDACMATAVTPPAGSERGSIAPACVRLGFRLGSSVMGLDVADEDALGLLEHAYALLRCPPSGARVQASLRRLSDGGLHVRYGRQALRMASAADPVPARAAYHAAREIFARFASERPESVAFYGALCAVDSAAVLVLGPTMIGKTLLALHLAQSGARFLGDETALLSLSNAEAYAMPRLPALRESALPLLPKSMARDIEASGRFFPTERGRYWYALGADALGGIEPSGRPYTLRAVCVLSARADAPSVRRMEPADGVQVLAQRAYVRPTTLAQVAALRRATRHATFLEMTLGDPQASSARLLREVRACV